MSVSRHSRQLPFQPTGKMIFSRDTSSHIMNVCRNCCSRKPLTSWCCSRKGMTNHHHPVDTMHIYTTFHANTCRYCIKNKTKNVNLTVPKKKSHGVAKSGRVHPLGNVCTSFKAIHCIVVEVFHIVVFHIVFLLKYFSFNQSGLHPCCCCEDEMILHKYQLPKIGICGTSLDLNRDMFVKMFPQNSAD